VGAVLFSQRLELRALLSDESAGVVRGGETRERLEPESLLLRREILPASTDHLACHELEIESLLDRRLDLRVAAAEIVVAFQQAEERSVELLDDIALR